MKIAFWLTTTLFLLFTSSSFAQTDSLRQQIENIIATKKADVGVSILSIEDSDTLSVNGDKSYPLMSVFKFPVALFVLHKVDKGELNINQKILIRKSDVIPNTWSIIREKYPNGNIKLSLAEILTYTVSQSDNIGCDILLRLIGGPINVQTYINKIVGDDFVIKVNEEAMRKDFNTQKINTATPLASTELLKVFYDKKILSKKSNDFLKKLMTESSTGDNRIKGQLPKKTIVAHKTGTSDTNEEGLTIATNDIGVVTLPNGNHFAISVFVSNSKERSDTNENIIADIARLTWNYFNNKTK